MEELRALSQRIAAALDEDESGSDDPWEIADENDRESRAALRHVRSTLIRLEQHVELIGELRRQRATLLRHGMSVPRELDERLDLSIQQGLEFYAELTQFVVTEMIDRAAKRRNEQEQADPMSSRNSLPPQPTAEEDSRPLPPTSHRFNAAVYREAKRIADALGLSMTAYLNDALREKNSRTIADPEMEQEIANRESFFRDHPDLRPARRQSRTVEKLRRATRKESEPT